LKLLVYALDSSCKKQNRKQRNIARETSRRK
jgi:hypothetical protein